MIYNWFQHIEFRYPLLLWVLLLLPVLTAWYIRTYNRRQGSLMLSSLQQVPEQRSFKMWLRHFPFILRLLAIACIIVALARPQTRNDEELTNGEGIDIVLCIDVSGSMLAQDLKPNRMESAKQVAANFVSNRPTDRIGLVIFSGESFTLSPLTTDQLNLKAQIFNIRSGQLEDGTAIGDGLGTSVERLKGSTAKSKVVILLTDGENNRGFIDPNTAKELAKSLGIRVYTIGVGVDGSAPVPVQTEMGIVMQEEKVNIDEKLLTQIAHETGGNYFRARDNQQLKNIYTEIDKLEKSKVEVTALHRFNEKFFPLALAAIALLFLEAILRLTVFKKFP